MKKLKQINYAIAAIMIAATVFIVSCNKEATLNPGSSNSATGGEVSARMANSEVYLPTSNPFGKSMGDWGAAFYKWQFKFDCDRSPLLDTTGIFQNQGQHGPVFFLGGVPIAQPPITRHVTIPEGEAIFIPVVYYFDNTGCGEVESNLISNVSGVVPAMDQLSLTIDGDSITSIANYKVISSVFNSAGNSCFNSMFCIDGTIQQVVIGGDWVILKPLSPGKHVIHSKGGASSLFPFVFDLTYNITVSKEKSCGQ